MQSTSGRARWVAPRGTFPQVSVRVGFLGAGLIANYHSKSLRGSGTPAIWSAVFDPEPARAARFAEKTGALLARTEDEVIEASDAVYVCTWTSEHPRLVARVATAGKAVFCEKPLAIDLAGARAMTEAVQTAGVVNQVGLVLRHSPAFGMLRALVADTDAHGQPMSVVFRDDQFIPIQGHYGSTWRGDVARAGAGTLLEHSIHDLDLLEYVLGPVVSVAAMTSNRHGIPGIEDGAVLTLRFANGALGTLVSVWHDVLERPSLRRVEVFSERCLITVEGDWFGPVTWQATGRAEQRASEAALEDAARARGAVLGNPDGAFVTAVAAGQPAWPTFADALRAHELADAAYRSAASGGAPVDTAEVNR